MIATGYAIALASDADIAGILDLQQRNLASHGGTLSVPFSLQFFKTAVANKQVLVARKTGAVVGYLVFSAFGAQAHVPVVQAMLEVYPGSPGAYNYGPICVAESERGRGLAGAMFANLQAHQPGREGIAFIRCDNVASVQAHTRMGMQQVGAFSHDGISFVIMAYGGPQRK